jgi:hypothetical protein
MKGMVQSVESQSKRYWISSKAIMPTVRSEQRPDKQFSIFACVVAEQCGEPERRIGRILKSEFLGRRRVTLVVMRLSVVDVRRATGEIFESLDS